MGFEGRRPMTLLAVQGMFYGSDKDESPCRSPRAPPYCLINLFTFEREIVLYSEMF